MTFGKKLRIIRVINDLTQTQMSQRLHLSQPVYSRYENDKKKATENDELVQRVVAAFNVQPKWLTSTDVTHNLPETYTAIGNK